jgi:PHD/YefM family antitoxin component YafN of YafNO toxin-antitoxin module
MVLKEDVLSLTDFARNTKLHTVELAASGRPRILTQNGKAAAVVLSPEAYERLSYDAGEYRLNEKLREAIERHLAGEWGVPGKEGMASLREETAARRKSRK